MDNTIAKEKVRKATQDNCAALDALLKAVYGYGENGSTRIADYLRDGDGKRDTRRIHGRDGQ